MISGSFLRRMRNISDKSCRENHNTPFMFSNFFENLAVHEIMCKNIVEPDRTQMTVRRMRIACWIIVMPLPQRSHKRTSKLRYTYIACLAYRLVRYFEERRTVYCTRARVLEHRTACSFLRNILSTLSSGNSSKTSKRKHSTFITIDAGLEEGCKGQCCMKIYRCTRPNFGWVDHYRTKRNATLRTEYLALIDWNPSTCFSFRLDGYINRDNIRFWASGNHSYRTASANRRYPSVVTVSCALRRLIIFGSVVIRGTVMLAAYFAQAAVIGLSLLRPGFDPRPVYGEQNDTGTLFSPMTSIFLYHEAIIPSMLHAGILFTCYRRSIAWFEHLTAQLNDTVLSSPFICF
jgi:hypothetical protein